MKSVGVSTQLTLTRTALSSMKLPISRNKATILTSGINMRISSSWATTRNKMRSTELLVVLNYSAQRSQKESQASNAVTFSNPLSKSHLSLNNQLLFKTLLYRRRTLKLKTRRRTQKQKTKKSDLGKSLQPAYTLHDFSIVQATLIHNVFKVYKLSDQW